MNNKKSDKVSIIKLILENFPVVSLTLMLVSVLINFLINKSSNKTVSLSIYFMRYGFLFMLGLTSLWASIFHIFLSNITSKSIGWKSNSFETEIGFVNFGLCVLGVISSLNKTSSGFKLATIIITSIFLLLAASNHIKDAIINKNYALNNIGTIMVHDIGTPLILIITYVLVYCRK